LQRAGLEWEANENWHYWPAAGGQDFVIQDSDQGALEEKSFSREAHIGVARVPDERLDKLSALYSPKKTTYATVEYVDVAAIVRKR